MTVIRTKRNFVYACEPQEQDCFVHTWLMHSQKRHLLSTRTIDHCQAAVDRDVGMADQMAHPVEVVTVDGVEYLKRNRNAPEGRRARLTDQERGELRQQMVASMTQILRDGPDDEVCAGACEVLRKLKVIPRC